MFALFFSSGGSVYRLSRIFLFALLCVSFAAAAHAQSFVTFNASAGSQNLTWPDGTFSHDLSGIPGSDGFYTLNVGDTHTAYNGFGGNNEFITFNSPVSLLSLQAIGGATQNCCAFNFETLTVSLYGIGNVFLTSLTDSNPLSLQTLAFNQSGVEKILFSYTTDQTAAWYVVSNIEYNQTVAPTPEPSTWLLFASGLAGLCFLLLKRSAS
jgi:hypothetical protein